MHSLNVDDEGALNSLFRNLLLAPHNTTGVFETMSIPDLGVGTDCCTTRDWRVETGSGFGDALWKALPSQNNEWKTATSGDERVIAYDKN